MDTSLSRMYFNSDLSFKNYSSKPIIASVVPWHHPDQFLKVYDYLYCKNITQKRWAVDQIDVWETRCHPSLPTAIEASQIITKAIIQDILYMNQSNFSREQEIQLMYSMALVRFVNLSVELHQSYAKQPLADIAERLGIPSWIVDLRNESAHSCLPTLPVLRMGAEEAMKYLDYSYWSIESTRLQSNVYEPISTNTVKALIMEYQYVQYQMLKISAIKSDNYVSLKKVMQDMKKRISRCIEKHRKEFIQVMCMEGIFITSEKDLNELRTLESKVCNGIKHYGNSDTQPTWDQSLEEDSASPPLVPAILEVFWCPILRLVNMYDAISELVEELLYIQGNRNAHEKKLIAAWVVKVVTFSLNPMIKSTSLVVKEFQKCAPLFDWYRLFGALASSPTMYTPFIYPMVDQHMTLNKEFTKSVMCLMAIYLGLATDCVINPRVIPADQDVFTLEDLKIARRRQERKMRPRRKEPKNIWSLAPDTIDWQQVPIGHVFTDVTKEVPNMDEDWRDLIDKTEYKESYFINKNDSEEEEDMDGSDTVKQDNTFEEELQKIISAGKISSKKCF